MLSSWSGPRPTFFIAFSMSYTISCRARTEVWPKRFVGKMTSLNKHIWDLIAPTVESMGFDLVRVRVSGDAASRVLQIMAERPDRTMSLEDCAEVSHALSALMDVEDPITGEYALEVSSPGIARPLVRQKDFEDFAGHLVKVELDTMLHGRKRFKGILDGVEDEHVMIAEESDRNEAGDPMVWGLPIDSISEARLVMTDALLEQAKGQE